MLISLIVAMAENRVIGRDGALPWRLPADLRFFKQTTMGKPVIMGRKTFESIGKPLPGRRNIVLTRDAGFRAESVEVVRNLDSAMQQAGDAAEALVIGGAEIYRLALPRADRIYLTEVHRNYEGDAWFPEFDPRDWREAGRERHAAEADRPAFSFVQLDRAAPAAG